MKGIVIAMAFMLLFAFPVNTTYFYEEAKENNLTEIVSNGKILYVGGSGPGNYTKIQDAIDNASDGDTVFVYGGIYYENVVINKSINLIGETKETTIIDGAKRGNVIYVWGNGTHIINFTIQHGGGDWLGAGIFIYSSGNVISNNIIRNNGEGILLMDLASSHNKISENTVINNTGIGIDLFNADNNNVEENNVLWNGGDGITVADAGFNTIEKNTLADTIYLGRAYRNIVKDNSFSEGGVRIWYSSDNKLLNNTINGKPIVYLEGKTDVEIDEGSQVILVGCEGIKIRNLHISNTCTAIHLSYCKRCVIEKNIIENNSNGIEIYSSGNIIIRNNKISNSTYDGCLIWSSFVNIIRRNSFENNKQGLDIAIFSALNMISKNNFKGNKCGINMTLCFVNAILRNNFLKNEKDETFIAAPITLWLRNYWDTWKLPLPKPIHGYGLDFEPCVKFDWMPRLFPYRWYEI